VGGGHARSDGDALPILKPCVERLESGHPCGELSPNSRCPTHTRIFEKARVEREPWRLLYVDPRWTRTSFKVIQRDGYRCTFEATGRRCAAEHPLSAHHETKLRILWERAGRPQKGTEGWEKFVRRAIDVRHLRTLCERHHKLVDNTKDPGERFPTPVEEQASSTHRRGLNHARRMTKKHSRQRRAREQREGAHDDDDR
jgi:hypothetical protein